MSNLTIDILLPYIPNKDLCQSIIDNMKFIEKYLDKIDEFFNNDIEKQLAYKQLLVMSFSVLESIWNGLAYQIVCHCNNKKCLENCKYKRYEDLTQINYDTYPFDVFLHLENTRLLYFSPSDYILIKQIKNSRNNIHLSNIAINQIQQITYDKSIVGECLNVIYDTLDQSNLLYEYYYKNPNSCIKELDGNCYKENKRAINIEYKLSEILNSTNACIKIFNNKLLSEKEIFYLSSLKPKGNKELVDIIAKRIYFEKIHYKSEEDYQNKKDSFYDILSRYIDSKSKLIKNIKNKVSDYENHYKAD